jgi:light-regulated signal transduction histidine kinase (bacteriophytochrome)
LRRAQDDLKAYAGKLERSNKELERFATVASHDLQEPLRKVMIFSDHLKMISQATLSAEALDDIQRMQRATCRMQNLIDDLLDLSRVNRGVKPFQKLDLAEVIMEVLSDLDLQIQESGGQVDVGNMMTIEADPRQMEQLLENLISNALKFHREGVPPIVKISAEPMDNMYCRIVVEDNGIGIKAEYYERIFEAFVRLHGKEMYPGTGIGLAICKKIVERHEGGMTIESIPNQGSRFIITLPRYQSNQCSSDGSD